MSILDSILESILTFDHGEALNSKVVRGIKGLLKNKVSAGDKILKELCYYFG